MIKKKKKKKKKRTRRRRKKKTMKMTRESSCSRIAYRTVSPKAMEPLILIIGYSLASPHI